MIWTLIATYAYAGIEIISIPAYEIISIPAYVHIAMSVQNDLDACHVRWNRNYFYS